jgi:YidC/Oxa1 family membrane protein insertase
MNNMMKFSLNESSWMTKLLYKPLFNLLMLLYVYIPGQDLGLAIIGLTLIIRIILFPSYLKTLQAQQSLKKLQPHIDRVKEEFKHDKTQQSQELVKLYQEHKVNPLGGCLPLIIQLPVLYALYRVFTVGLSNESLTHLYTWFPKVPTTINTTFLAFTHMPSLTVNLAAPNIYLAILAGIVQLVQSLMMKQLQPASSPGDGGMAKIINAQMIYFFPIFTVFIAWSLPAALSLYWVATTFFMVIQQMIILKRIRE